MLELPNTLTNDEVNNILMSVKTPYATQSSKVANTIAQAARVVGGIAKGTLKTVAAPELLKEAGQKKYNNPGQAANIKDPYKKSTTEQVKKAASSIQNWQNKWTPEPQSGAAEFAAKAANTIGEAIPVAGAAVLGGASGAAGVLAGNALSYAAGSAQAVSSELLDGSGDPERALLKGATAWVSEAIGGKTFDKIAGKIASPVLSLGASAVGEGLEENIDSLMFSAATRDRYTAKEAVQDFALGATAGAILGGGANAVNASVEAAVPKLVERAVNQQVKSSAASDIKNVTELVGNADQSTASAIVAEDSLTAIQKSVANPVNTSVETTSIPNDIASRFRLTPASESGGNPISINKISYESIVDPAVSGLETRAVSIEERATANPNDITTDNPRALYKYADDIYLRPGTDTGQFFTYRGQANQFYSSSVENGFPASGKGTSWEGSGVYSSPIPYTTDLYGPSGRLSDNPYINRGIDQTAIKSDYPVGVILAQPQNLTEETGRLTRTDAPDDVVQEGTRRVRSDPNGNLVTEVINNPSDVQAVGLNFGRQTIEEASPIKYASAELQSDAKNNVSVGESGTASSTVPSQSRATVTESVEESGGQYTVPKLIKNTESVIVANAEQESESRTESAPKEINTASEIGSNTERSTETGTQSIKPETAINYASKESTGAQENAVTNATKSIERPETIRNGNDGLNSGIETVSNPYTNLNYGNNNGLSGNAIESRASTEYSKEEEKARSIWMPEQYNRQVNAQNNDASNPNTDQRNRRERDRSSGDFGTMRGNGSVGRVYESDSYKSTFGTLSSF